MPTVGASHAPLHDAGGVRSRPRLCAWTAFAATACHLAPCADGFTDRERERADCHKAEPIDWAPSQDSPSAGGSWG